MQHLMCECSAHTAKLTKMCSNKSSMYLQPQFDSCWHWPFSLYKYCNSQQFMQKGERKRTKAKTHTQMCVHFANLFFSSRLILLFCWCVIARGPVFVMTANVCAPSKCGFGVFTWKKKWNLIAAFADRITHISICKCLQY